MSVVGFDIGNQCCRVAVAHRGIIEIIANEVSNRRTPSLVAFDGHQRQLGEAAQTRLLSNYANTIFDIKRLVGKNYNDADLQRDLTTYGILNNGVYGPASSNYGYGER
jgi:molecular chaperone DnaK (HSP70)